MKEIAIFDFDNTITRTDTNKILISVLFFFRPHTVIYRLCLAIIRAFFMEDKSSQRLKNSLLVSIMEGMGEASLKRVAKVFAFCVQPLFRRIVANRVDDIIARGTNVLIVTASPRIIVEACFSDKMIKVLGTEFQFETNSKLVSIKGKPCFGSEKVTCIQNWVSHRFEQINFSEAWSDAPSDLPMMLLAKRRFWVGSSKSLEKIEKLDPQASFIIV